MNGAMKTRLRVTGFGIVIAALIAHWAFGQDAQRIVKPVDPALVVDRSRDDLVGQRIAGDEEILPVGAAGFVFHQRCVQRRVGPRQT